MNLAVVTGLGSVTIDADPVVAMVIVLAPVFYALCILIIVLGSAMLARHEAAR